MSVDAMAVIARCTRNGVISWQQVSKQMGISIDRARRLYDPVSSSRHDPQQMGEWAMPAETVDENDTSSPHIKGPGLKDRILKLLEIQSMPADVLGAALSVPTNSIRARLDRLLDAGMVQHDGRYPRTWSLAGRGAISEARAA